MVRLQNSYATLAEICPQLHRRYKRTPVPAHLGTLLPRKKEDSATVESPTLCRWRSLPWPAPLFAAGSLIAIFPAALPQPVFGSPSSWAVLFFLNHLPVAFVTSLALSIALLFIDCMAFGTYTSNHWAIRQILAGPLMAGRCTSFRNGFGSLSGIMAPWLAGFIMNFTGSSKPAFGISALIVLAGALMRGLLVEPVEEVRGRHA